jgi:uncharacterized protein (TIGR00730 family)
VSERGQGPRAIAVFGGSEAAPETIEYRNARELGRLIASAGWAIINGGYGGVMEASARGARDAGGRTIGVTTRAFAHRGGPNLYIETELTEADLHDRTRRLIESASAFIILPGKSGTLAELSFLWALQRAGLLGPKPIVLLGTIWAELLRTLRGLNLVGDPELAVTRIALSPSEAVNAILASLQGVR